MQNEITNNMNANGGGLAHNITGKYESNRNALAKLDSTKRTAGQVAQSLRKQGYQVKATEIKQFCEEWHHAGFYDKGMARTYYTQKTDEQILSEYETEKTKVIKYEKLRGVYYVWERGTDKYGKKTNFKVLCTFEGKVVEGTKPADNFIKLTPKQFRNAQSQVGKAYYGWDEPKVEDFK